MMIVLDLRKSVMQLCHENDEIINILRDLGFLDITKPGMLSTVGRVMTIPKGAKMKGISMDVIKDVFVKKGYEIIN